MQHANRTIAVAGITVLVAAALVSPASATDSHKADSHKTWRVSPGMGTISKAVTDAKAGDTLELKKGTFFDSVLIDKTLTIRGAGWSKTIIKPLANPLNPCNFEEEVLGLCVLGAVDAMFNPDFTKPVKNVKISDLRLTGFADGVLGFNAKGLKVKDVRADHNTGYGIAAFASTLSVFSENRTSWNGFAGLYMGDSPKARNVISKNKTDHNGIGIFMRDSTKLTATDNDAWGNCAGILALNSGHGAVPAGDYKIIDNDVEANNKACPSAGEDPAFSGLGIALAGVHDVLVKDNEVKNHRSKAASDVPKGGIVVFSTAGDGGADPTNNTVTRNEVRKNKPFDIFYNKTGSGNKFKDNECKKSMPTKICSH